MRIFLNTMCQNPRHGVKKTGEDVTFTIKGKTISFNSKLDLCVKYKKEFVECAKYYTDRFKYKYELCAIDYDSFLNYFMPMYGEGLLPMVERATSLFLPLGIFDVNLEAFLDTHYGNTSLSSSAVTQNVKVTNVPKT